jgi:ABC-type transport system involved in multi-copper enzyme maturation permease subunit
LVAGHGLNLGAALNKPSLCQVSKSHTRTRTRTRTRIRYAMSLGISYPATIKFATLTRNGRLIKPLDMSLPPIVERELRVAARRVGTYRNRMLTPALLALAMIGRVLLVTVPPSRPQWGKAVFQTLTSLALVFCVLEGVRKTADCLSAERREGTLGLLFLTDLKGHDVILGKLAAASLSAIYGLLALVPILAWSLIFGGVTPGEIWRIVLALASILFFSLAAGIWVSSRSRSAGRAMAGTFGLLLLFLVVPAPMTQGLWAPFSPAYAFFGAPDAIYSANPLAYWVSLLLTQIFSWSLLARASATITHLHEEENAGHRPSPWRLGSPPSPSKHTRRRAKLRTELLGTNPVCWLASRNPGSSYLVWFLVVLVGTGLICRIFVPPSVVRYATVSWWGSVDFMFVAFALVMNSGVKILLASQACRCLAEARRNNTLEVLLCAPMTVEQILQGQILSLKRRFLKPVLLLLAIEMAGLFWALRESFGPSAGVPGHLRLSDAVAFAEAAFVIFFLVDMQGVAWAGIWFGLCSRNESQATFKTIFYVVLLPFLLLILYCLGIALFLAWPVASLVWARLKLQEQFRALAGQRAAFAGEASGWLPFKIPEIKDEPLADVPR